MIKQLFSANNSTIEQTDIIVLLTPRIMYIYYALPLVPAAAIAVALLLTRSGIPRAVQWGFMAAYLAGFAAYFPFRQIP